MTTIKLNAIRRIIIYGNGQKLMEKRRDFDRVGTWSGETVNTDYWSRILSINLSTEPKNARKENLNRKDNYYLPVKDTIFNIYEPALYVHFSEVNFSALGEYIANNGKDEKHYLYAYKIGFKHGAVADIHHFEKLNVPGDWKLPEGATWDNGRNYYSIIDAEKSHFARKLAEKRGEKFTEYNMIHHWFTTEPIGETVLTSEGYHKTVKSPALIARETLKEKLNAAIGRDRLTEYDVEKLIERFTITEKTEV